MSTITKGRRLPTSCVNCRRRKIKCEKLTSRACRRCERLGLDCDVTEETIARPYYHTSKERFELMAKIVRHFSPATSLNVQDLRDYVSSLTDTSNKSWNYLPQHVCSPPSVSQSAEVEAQGPTDLVDVSSPMESEGHLDGAFIPDATSQFRFNGASSYTVLQSKVSMCIAAKFPQLVSLSIDPKFDLRDGQPLLETPHTALPDRKSCERCGVTFFHQINSVFYILSPETFFHTVENVYRTNDASPSIQSIFHLIVALMDESQQHFELARMQMESVIEEGSLESVQALTLMALYRQKQNQRHTSWVVLGSAVRIAQSLGMHIKRDGESPLWKEQKTRLWWSLYELDQWTSCMLGRFSGLVVDENRGLAPSDCLIAGANTPPMYASASAHLAQFLSRAVNCIYLKQQCLEEDIGSLLRDLNTWWASLPEHLVGTAILDQYARATLYLRLRFHYVLILITRPFLFNAAFIRPGTNPHVKICEENNDCAITTLLDMRARNLLTDRLWFDTHHILSTALILLLRIIKKPSSSELRVKATSMQALLRISSGQIQSYAIECFDRIFQDIDQMRSDTGQDFASDLDTRLPIFDSWEQLDFFEPDSNFIC